MSGVRSLARIRRQQPPQRRMTKAEKARTLTQAALGLYRLPGLDDEGRRQAVLCLDLAVEYLTPPRSGWFPRRPKGWKP